MECIIYQIKCRDESVKETYIGSTKNFKHRKAVHKSMCNNTNSSGYNYKLYKCMRKNGGYDNWTYNILKEGNYENVNELHKQERYYIETIKSNLNEIIPTRTHGEYYRENIEVMKQKRHDEYERNKHKYKQYGIENREYKNAYLKEYREKNKELIREKEKERNKVSVVCENCNKVIRKRGLTNHKKSRNCKKSL